MREPAQNALEAWLLNLPVRQEQLTLRTRAIKTCQYLGIETLDELCQASDARLLRAPNFGRHALRFLHEALAQGGRSLNETVREQIEVTPRMIEAGMVELSRADRGEVVSRIYRAMEAARRNRQLFEEQKEYWNRTRR